jgi:hypothetical protein
MQARLDLYTLYGSDDQPGPYVLAPDGRAADLVAYLTDKGIRARRARAGAAGPGVTVVCLACSGFITANRYLSRWRLAYARDARGRVRVPRAAALPA